MVLEHAATISESTPIELGLAVTLVTVAFGALAFVAGFKAKHAKAIEANATAHKSNATAIKALKKESEGADASFEERVKQLENWRIRRDTERRTEARLAAIAERRTPAHGLPRLREGADPDDSS